MKRWQVDSCFSGRHGARDKILVASPPSTLFLFLSVPASFSVTTDRFHMTVTATAHSFTPYAFLLLEDADSEKF